MIGPGLTRTRVLLAVGLGAVLLVVAAASVAARPSGSPDLPPIAPERLIASTLRALAQDPPVSGRLAAHLDLGLPSIPDEGPGAALPGAGSFLASLSGNHRLRIWTSADGFRLADLLRASERAIFASRTDVWAWDFDSFTAYHLAHFPEGSSPHRRHGAPAMSDLVDPLALTRKALGAIAPSTGVSVGTTRIAGRDAYLLVLRPRSADTLVVRVEIGIDAERRVPLRVAVYSRLRRAAPISVAFTSVSFASIDPSVYRFRPPPGAKVRDLSREFGGGKAGKAGKGGKEGKGGKGQGIEGSARDEYGAGGAYGEAPAKVFGHDWTTVVALRTPPLATLRGMGDGFDPMSLLPISGPLLSISVVDRGDHAWLVYGLVPQSSLLAVSGDLP